MKTFQSLKIVIGVLVALGMIFQMPALADTVSKRDISADSVLLKNGGMAGLVPATGSQALPGGILPTTGRPLGSAADIDLKLEGIRGSGLKDKKANVYQVAGNAKIRSKEGGPWAQAQPGMLIKEGHEVLTSADGYISITFDSQFLNVVHVPANTKAVIRSIEPTDIFLEDGRIYNVLDGLPRGSEWTVSTPVAVSAVRGTWYLVGFTASDGSFISATFDVPDDGVSSSVEVIEVVAGQPQGASANIPEGNQIALNEGQKPDPSLISNIDPKYLNQMIDFLEKLGEYRSKNDGALPPTGSDFFNGGPGNEGDGNELDPLLDTGGASLFGPPQEDQGPPNEDPGGPGDCDNFPDC